MTVRLSVRSDSRFAASTAQRNIKLSVDYSADYQRVTHCLSTRRVVVFRHNDRTEKGLLLCSREPKFRENEEE
ncbi:hypothetical protein M072_2404 [Bacteroides fragilis str. DS-208]|nr:hypothetical protein M072_2404 [Bacteroides fragilis str. DS-208]